MTNERAFRGVWIPADLWLNRSLSIQEKVMLIEIDSLSKDPERGCYKKNQGFAEFFGLSKNRVSEIIKSLESKGFIRVHYQRQGKEIVERNIFIIAPFDKPTPPSEKCDNPFGKAGQPPSENREERGSSLRGSSLRGSEEGVYTTPAKPSLCGVKFETRDGVWNCPDDYYKACCDQYGQHNVDGEFKNAAFWLLSNPAKRKTARGMKKFLGSWLQRKAERDPTFKPVELPTPTKRNFHTGELTEQQKADSERGRALLSGLKGNLG